MNEQKEQIRNPSHYGGADNPYEAIKIIEHCNLDFHLGNTIKYILRAGKKDKNKEVEDLQKAKWYLERKIEQMTKTDLNKILKDSDNVEKKEENREGKFRDQKLSYVKEENEEEKFYYEKLSYDYYYERKNKIELVILNKDKEIKIKSIEDLGTVRNRIKIKDINGRDLYCDENGYTESEDLIIVMKTKIKE